MLDWLYAAVAEQRALLVAAEALRLEQESADIGVSPTRPASDAPNGEAHATAVAASAKEAAATAAASKLVPTPSLSGRVWAYWLGDYTPEDCWRLMRECWMGAPMEVWPAAGASLAGSLLLVAQSRVQGEVLDALASAAASGAAVRHDSGGGVGGGGGGLAAWPAGVTALGRLAAVSAGVWACAVAKDVLLARARGDAPEPA